MTRLSTATAVVALTTAPAFAQDTFFQLDEIIFSAGLTALEASRVGVSVDALDEEELASYGEVPLAEVLDTIPGVSITRNGGPGTSTTVRIRGAGDGLIGVYVDGILVNDPTGTSGQFNGFGTLTSGSVRRIEVLRGSQSAIYGGSAAAGVISISTLASGDEPEGITQTSTIEAGSYNTFSADYSYTQRSGPLTLSFGISHTQTDGFSAAEENTGNTEADPFRATRTSIGAIYEASPNFTIGANAFYETSDTEFDEFVGSAPGDGTPGDETGGSNTTGVRVFAEYKAGVWSHTLTGTYLNIDRRSQSASVLSPFSSPFSSVFDGERRSFQYLATTQAIPDTELSFGLDWEEEVGAFTGIAGGTQRIITGGVFAEAVWSPNENFDLFASSRYEEHSSFGDVSTARLAFSYRMGAGTTLRGAISNGYRPPALSELFGVFPLSGGFSFVGNANLQPETTFGYEIGADHEFQNGASVSATLFRSRVDNFITYQDCTRDPVTSICTSNATNANIPGVTTLQGLELSGSTPITGNLTLTGAYTYTDARSANGVRVARVPRHDLAVALDAEFGEDWSANLSMTTIADIMDSTGGRVGDNYTVFDTSISYAVNDANEVYLRVENLFDEEYQTVRGYGTSDRAFYLGLRSQF